MTERLPNIALVCDEAGKAPDRYLAVGGLVVTDEDVKMIRAEFMRRTGDLGLTKEAKWNLTRSSTLDEHRELIHWAFQLITAGQLMFHCLLVPSQRFNHNLRPVCILPALRARIGTLWKISWALTSAALPKSAKPVNRLPCGGY
ncbi:MAG: hypothetical protein IPG62_16395 [Sphingomonadales bacterium]|nr:hypothetical protein [Sphingomonadales bacterium]